MDRELLLIRMLLVMGCVERNPGPPVKKFTFRYQHLLIDIGTQVTRKIFDGRAVPDLMTFLTNNHAKLQVMIKKKIITPAQEKLLPPKEPNPSSEHFDITLLCCMLRNICGLCPPGDIVWSQPASTDKSLEAYITRLRLCRNNVSHSESVLEDETILKDKWTELCDILTELGKFCNFNDLPTLIKKAESIEIDEHLKERFEAALKLWDEMETMFDRKLGEIIEFLGKMDSKLGTMSKGQVEIIKNQKEIGTKLGEIHNEITQSNQSKDCQRVDNISETEAVRQKLIDIYQQKFEFIQLCPRVEYEKGEVFTFYQVPEMKEVDYHKIEKQQTKQSHSGHTMINCKDIFCKGDKQCKDIYLTADAGLGKTTFSRVLAFLWCNSKIGNQIKNEKLQDYANYLTRFEFVFYINLRDTEELNVVSMIRNQLKPYLSDDKYVNLYETIEQILYNHESLVILDGLDEWAPKLADKQKYELPIRPESSKCVYLTLCRPYKIENVRLLRSDIDHQVQMIGFDEEAIKSYVASLVHYINTINDNDSKIFFYVSKDSKKFLDEVERVRLSFLLHIPMIASQMVMLWFDRPIKSMTRSMVYGNIMDLLFKIAHERMTDIPAQTSFYLCLPDALSDLYYLRKNIPLVEKLCLLSYRLYFEHDINITSLVFTREQLASEPYDLSEAETNLFCKIGILSKSQVYREFGKQEFKVGFLHKSYMEFLAAVYVSTLETSQVLDLFNTCTTIKDVLKFKTFLIFYAGLSPKGIKSLISRIYSLISDDLIPKRNLICSACCLDDLELNKFIDIILTCHEEGSLRGENPILLEDFVLNSPFHYDYTYDFKPSTMVSKRLLSLNGRNVKFLMAVGDKYHDEFEKIENLQWLTINMFEKNDYVVKFNELMSRNKSSLHSVSIRDNREKSEKITPNLPESSLQNLTSLTLIDITMSHQLLQSTVKFLSNNSLLKLIYIDHVNCDEYQKILLDCTISCDFSNCNKLQALLLKDTNISCSKVNVSSLNEISLSPLSQNIAACYGGIFECLQHASALSSLTCDGKDLMHSDTVKSLIACIPTHSSLKSLELQRMELPDNIQLTLHPDVTELNIFLRDVTLSHTCFESLINNLTKIPGATLWRCIITKADGDNLNKMSDDASYVFMYDYLQKISTVNITSTKSISKPYKVQFEKRSV